MKFFVGTSGFQYGHWDNGVFYPPGIRDRLDYLSQRLNTVEINASFYKIPAPETVARWAEKIPERFKLTLKAPQSVSHRRRLKLYSEGPVRHGIDLLSYFLDGVAKIPESKRGPVLLQLPQHMKRDTERLSLILPVFTKRNVRVAFEVRHESWFVDEVFEVLKKNNSAMVSADWSSFKSPLVITADFLYIRRHGPKQMYTGNYSDRMLTNDIDAMIAKSRGVKEAYVFFNNDRCGFAPKNAISMTKLVRSRYPRSI